MPSAADRRPTNVSTTTAAAGSSVCSTPAIPAAKCARRGTPRKWSGASTTTPTPTSPSRSSTSRPRSPRRVLPDRGPFARPHPDRAGGTRSPPGTERTCRTDRPKPPTTSSNGSSGSRSGSPAGGTTGSASSSNVLGGVSHGVSEERRTSGRGMNVARSGRGTDEQTSGARIAAKGARCRFESSKPGATLPPKLFVTSASTPLIARTTATPDACRCSPASST